MSEPARQSMLPSAGFRDALGIIINVLGPTLAKGGRCPGRQLVLLVTSAMLAALVHDRRVLLKPPPRLDPREPLPGTLNNYALRFQIAT